MSDKLILCILLVGFLYLPTIFSEEISNEERTKAHERFYTEHYEKCKHTIPEETYQMLLDGSSPDDEQIRDFCLCLFKAYKWIVNKKVEIETLLIDLPHLIGRKFTPSETVAIRIILNICKKEGEVYTTEMKIMLIFYRCMVDQLQSDI